MCHNPLDRVACKIISNDEIAPNIFDMKIEAPGLCDIAVPGQFVNMYCKDSSRLVPRPISICEVNKETGVMRLIYAVVGEGTIEFATYLAGDDIDILGPLGSGFDLDKAGDSVLIVGGGVGTPPLLELSKAFKKNNPDVKLNIVLGFRDDSYLVEDFKAYGNVYLATDSGKAGFKGNVIDLMKAELADELQSVDQFYSCGPTPMLRFLQIYLMDLGLKGQFSLEERMGCGFGGCVGCVVPIAKEVPTKSADLLNKETCDPNAFEYNKVCKDGPVFDFAEVIF